MIHKFRSYDKENKIMLYDFDHNIPFEKYGIKIGDSIHQVVYKIGLSYGTFMMFTGIKDKSGQEWWEGDIIRINDASDMSTAVIVFRKGKFMKQFYKNGKPFLTEDTKQELFLNIDDFDLKHYHRIGNIYQNPDLLEK